MVVAVTWSIFIDDLWLHSQNNHIMCNIVKEQFSDFFSKYVWWIFWWIKSPKKLNLLPLKWTYRLIGQWTKRYWLLEEQTTVHLVYQWIHCHKVQKTDFDSVKNCWIEIVRGSCRLYFTCLFQVLSVVCGTVCNQRCHKVEFQVFFQKVGFLKKFVERKADLAS